MTGAAVFRFAILLAPVFMVLVASLDAALFLHSSRESGNAPLYLEDADHGSPEIPAA